MLTTEIKLATERREATEGVRQSKDIIGSMDYG